MNRNALYRAAVCALTVALVGSLLDGVPAVAAPVPVAAWRPSAPKERSVPGTAFTAKTRPASPGAASVLRSVPAVSWPAAGTAEVAPPAAGAGRVRAGNLPVWVGAPTTTALTNSAQRLRVGVLDRAAATRVGVSGLLFTLGGGTGRTPVEVDYSAFRRAYGGDWATRLRLVELPACALSTPERADCRTAQPLASRNDVRAGRVSAEVTLGAEASVLAVTAAASGSAGSYTATSLSPSSSWHAGDSSGDFGWSYPMDVPPGLGGPEPDLDLSYSSGSVDGRTASTNNQASWVGEGWDVATDYVERRYKSCADDVSFTPKPYDLCWETDNAFLSLGGRSLELVKDATTGEWHPRSDDGSRVQRLTGATNGDDDGEYWKVTAQDGTQYFFGLNRLPGWASGNEVTNSTWTVPVFGNDSGEPCHASTFAASYCSQAWRWNLDYVVDPDGNAETLFYDTETNSYGRNRTASADTSYVRGGYLKRIDYGQRSDTIYSAPAPLRVVFDVQERCAAGATCGTETITKDTAKNWPDVPYDQNCNAGATCTDLYAPTFWSRKRLSTVTSKVWVSGTTYKDVDTWALGYQFRDPGDGTAPALWLSSVTNTGKVGGSTAMPAVTFEGVQLENRVDALEGVPPMYKWRLTDVYDESGGHVHVNYSGKDCTRDAAPNPESNTKRCFPQYWTPEGATAPTLDWFHKYVAVQVLEDDQSGVAGIEETDYEYLGGGAWHHDDNALTPAKYRTWSEWRGFGRVRTTHGASGGVRSQDETLYFRGMDGDQLSGGTRSVSVTDSEGVAVTDHVALAGFVREETSYTGVGGTVLEGTIYDPWISAATATSGATKAYYAKVAKERERTALASGGWRRTETQISYDAYGLPVQVNDLGNTSTSADDTCTRTTYARNTTSWLIDFEAREEIVGVACTATPSYPADAISDERTFYDGSTTLGAAPTRGAVTLTQEAASYSGSTPSYTQVTRSTYDAYGRVLDTYDALDRKTTTSYTPASGGAVTGTTVTNPLGFVTTTTIEPAWGEATAVVDPNGRRTDLTYDPLGRLAALWLPDRSKSGGQTPNQRFSYLIQTTGPNVVTSETVRDDGTYEPSYAFYDGRLRPRQTQEVAPDGGRVVSDTFYDSRGLEVKRNSEYWNSGAAGTTLFVANDTAVPGQTVTVYDGAEREVADVFLSYGVEKWRTTTGYGGDRIDVTPPAGGTATTKVLDAEDHVTELRQYQSATPSGSYDTTTYTYAKNGDLATVTDPAGNVWRYTYDVRGRKVKDEDPDRGTTTYTYDNADQLLTSTDARGTTLARTYDALGRQTGLYEGSTSGTKRAGWTYDTLNSGVVVRGEPATATRYVDGNAYTVSVNGYDTRYRSLGNTVTIPASEGKLAGTYQTNTAYTSIGLPLTVSYPAAGGLAAETLRFGYDAYGRLTTAQTGLATLLTGATYTPYDEPSQYTLSAASGKQLVQTFTYEDGTRRLTRARADRSATPTAVTDVAYTYDAAGNVTRVADTGDTQCFRYDYLRRLTTAWTATDNCAATTPSTSVVGGVAPYWQAWTYDKTGNRLTETNVGAGTTSTYTYPAAGSARPHALSNVTGGTSFSYDATGNTIGRTIAGSTQTLDWDIEGNLTKVTEGSKVTEFLYDADGDRLIRRDPDAVTLYLDNAELKLTKSTNTVAATRFYAAGGATAVRTSAGLYFEIADLHGTADVSVNSTDLAVTQRRYLPFGELRGGAAASWPDEKGYVGGTVDATTGLTHLGAREYDPHLGRFLSVDPVVDPSEPQQLNAYAYANNTPITASDPDGEWRVLPGGHYCDGCGGYNNAPKHHKKAKKRHYSVPSGHPTQRFRPGTAKYRQHVRTMKQQSRALKRAAARHRAEARKRAAAKKKGGCHGFFGCLKHVAKKVVHKTVSIHKTIGKWAWKGVKTAWHYRSAILTACSIFATVICGTLAAINSAVDSYKAFRKGDIRGGILNGLSAATGGVGAAYGGLSKAALKGATTVRRIPTPHLPTRVGYRISGGVARGLGRMEAAFNRGHIGANFHSNMWSVASAATGVSASVPW